MAQRLSCCRHFNTAQIRLSSEHAVEDTACFAIGNELFRASAGENDFRCTGMFRVALQQHSYQPLAVLDRKVRPGNVPQRMVENL